jgi:hypothetical protein
MTYVYHCDYCESEYEIEMSILDDHTKPIKDGCLSCGKKGKVWRVYKPSPVFYNMGKSIHTVAANKVGSDWKDVLKGIKKGSGRKNTMPDL